MKNNKGFGKQKADLEVALARHPIYHFGIDRAVNHILRSIARTQFVFEDEVSFWITNDLPNDPLERSMGLTSEQIFELKTWLSANQSRLPKKYQVWVLRVQDCPSHRMLYKLKDWTKIMTKI